MRFWDTRTIQKIRRGYFSAVYFNRTKYILEQEKNLQVVTMQVFQKNTGSILCGTQEVKELFKVATGFWNKGQWINKFSSLKSDRPRSRAARYLYVIPSVVEGSSNLGRFLHSSTIVESVGMTTR